MDSENLGWMCDRISEDWGPLGFLTGEIREPFVDVEGASGQLFGGNES